MHLLLRCDELIFTHTQPLPVQPAQASRRRPAPHDHSLHSLPGVHSLTRVFTHTLTHSPTHTLCCLLLRCVVLLCCCCCCCDCVAFVVCRRRRCGLCLRWWWSSKSSVVVAFVAWVASCWSWLAVITSSTMSLSGLVVESTNMHTSPQCCRSVLALPKVCMAGRSAC